MNDSITGIDDILLTYTMRGYSMKELGEVTQLKSSASIFNNLKRLSEYDPPLVKNVQRNYVLTPEGMFYLLIRYPNLKRELDVYSLQRLERRHLTQEEYDEYIALSGRT